MKLRTWHVMLLTTGILLAVSTQSAAQRITPGRLKANPYRDSGGSCVYDRSGKLVNTPKGKTCKDRTDHLAKLEAEAPTSLVEGFPPALRNQLRKLFRDHAHISAELTRLRQSIQASERAEALGIADKVATEVADHRRREEDLLERLSNRHAKR